MGLRKQSCTCPDETLAIFMDFYNLETPLQNNEYPADMDFLEDYLSRGQWFIETFVFTNFISYEREHEQERTRFPKVQGFLIQSKTGEEVGEITKCGLMADQATNIITYIQQAKPKIAILITGNEDFGSMLKRMKFCGVKVKSVSMSSEVEQYLRDKVNGYVNLRDAVEGRQKFGAQSMNEERRASNANSISERR